MHETHEQTCIPHVGLRLLVTPFSAWHGWHIECTLTHTTGTRSAVVAAVTRGHTQPWLLSFRGSMLSP